MAEHYDHGEVRELESNFLPFGPEFSTATVVKVKPGSKLGSLVTFAEKQLQDDSCRFISFAGIGQACTKTVSAVEVLKRGYKHSLYQMTKVSFRRIEEIWNPKTPGLESLKVNRDIPAIYVLLSKDPLRSDEPGYQEPGRTVSLLREATEGSERRRQSNHHRQTNKPPTSARHKNDDAGNRWKRPKPSVNGRNGAKGENTKRRNDDSLDVNASSNTSEAKCDQKTDHKE